MNTEISPSSTPHFIVIVTGPTGAGKTTVSKRLGQYLRCAYLSEDDIAKESFPESYAVIERYPDRLKIITAALLNRAQELFAGGNNAILDMINLDEAFIEEAKNTFQNHLVIKVLWPSQKIAIARDRLRAGWVSGKAAIAFFYQKYEKLKPIIGAENYIDTSRQTPEETVAAFLSYLHLKK